MPPSLLILLLIVTAVTPAGATPASGALDVREIAMRHPRYRALEEDHELGARFEQYMKWLADLGTPDAKLVHGFMREGRSSLDALSAIYHEKVEFAGWLALGHRFEDILTVEYYQAHYLDVYPVAHRDAMIEELALIGLFAGATGSGEIPELAAVLVHPLVEHHHAPVAMMVRRLRHNAEFLGVPVAPADIERALEMYERGGHAYQDRERIRREAIEFIGQLDGVVSVH